MERFLMVCCRFDRGALSDLEWFFLDTSHKVYSSVIFMFVDVRLPPSDLSSRSQKIVPPTDSDGHLSRIFFGLLLSALEVISTSIVRSYIRSIHP